MNQLPSCDSPSYYEPSRSELDLVGRVMFSMFLHSMCTFVCCEPRPGSQLQLQGLHSRSFLVLVLTGVCSSGDEEFVFPPAHEPPASRAINMAFLCCSNTSSRELPVARSGRIFQLQVVGRVVVGRSSSPGSCVHE